MRNAIPLMVEYLKLSALAAVGTIESGDVLFDKLVDCVILFKHKVNILY